MLQHIPSLSSSGTKNKFIVSAQTFTMKACIFALHVNTTKLASSKQEIETYDSINNGVEKTAKVINPFTFEGNN